MPVGRSLPQEARHEGPGLWGRDKTMASMKLFHTGFEEIRKPDIHRGRANADFGQGFYLSPDEAFSRRWARFRKGQDTWLNVYCLETEGLAVKILKRDETWFDYIFHNRAGYKDSLAAYDVIIGPIANDTIYDTWGITTSGLLKPADALQLLSVGPEYTQAVLKTDRAADRLRFVSAHIIPESEISGYGKALRQEEEDYQNSISEIIREITERMEE